MTNLGAAWRRAWTRLVDAEPETLWLSTRVGDPDGEPLFLPSASVQKRVFPTVFRESLPQPDSNRLRRYPVDAGHPLTSAQLDLILVAVDEAGPRLRRIAALGPRIEARVTAKQLRAQSLREGVLALALDWTSEQGDLSDDDIGERLEPYKVSTSQTYPEGLRQALKSRELAESVATALARRPAVQAAPGVLDGSRRALREFLDTPGFAKLGTRPALDAGRSDPSADRAWAAARASGVATWHTRVRQMRLSEHEVPPLPPVVSHEPLPVLEPVLWLDTSIADRLAPALKFPLDERRELPDLRHYIDAEIERSTSPLGLSDNLSQSLMALAAVIVEEYVDQHDLETIEADQRALGFVADPSVRNAATVALVRLVHTWRRQKNAFEGSATFPGQAVPHIVDLVGWYMSALWRRVHTLEVQDRQLVTAGEAWWQLIQLGHSVLGNIREKPWPREGPTREGDVPDDPSSSAQDEQPEEPEASGDERFAADDWPELVERINDAIVSLGRVGIDLHRLTRFLKRPWDDVAHRTTWREWTDDAGIELSYEQLRFWWDQSRPET